MAKFGLYKKLQSILNDNEAKKLHFFEYFPQQKNIIKFVPWPLDLSLKNYNFQEIYNIETDVQTNVNIETENFDILAILEDRSIYKISDDDIINYYEYMIKIY
ncbi:hypothetical protein [Chryseobacterium sp. JUb7]|uniref:hypothetical protein n=1 Tax=Chryseobacterium sp. JUb7 TaxID=2940599 RepID=UPI0021699A1D|nr:hypothetical protein [Chryseobacterium sp. JUb7]MCS3532068.1 hypothetical protein [Chryseobacterium sp. JUb7]